MPQATTAKADATSASSAAAPGTTSEEAAEVLSALEEAACIKLLESVLSSTNGRKEGSGPKNAPLAEGDDELLAPPPVT